MSTFHLFAAVIGLICGALSAPLRADVVLVADPDAAPFAARYWPDHGVAAELVRAAMATGPDPLPLDLRWTEEGQNLRAEVLRHDADLAFPIPRPDCAAAQAPMTACEYLSYSDPVMDIVVLLFTRADAQFSYEVPQDLSGRTLCYATQAFGDTAPAWLSGTSALVLGADRLDQCFERLMTGAADAVAVNEFEGVAALFKMGLTQAVVPLPVPLGRETLHLVIAKSHARATTHLYRFNAGLAKLRETGDYQKIVDRHVGAYWDNLKNTR